VGVAIFVALFVSPELLAQQAPAGSAAQLTQRVRIDPETAADLLLKKVTPDYSAEAQKKGIRGIVTLRLLISRSGDVSRATLISGDPALALAAIEAAKQWKYEPYLVNGIAVSVETSVSLRFPPGSDSNTDPSSEVAAGQSAGRPPGSGVITGVIGSSPRSGGTATGVIGAVVKRNGDEIERVRLPWSVTQSMLLKEVQPEYPEAARKQPVKAGGVRFKGVISKEGDVIDLQLVSGLPVFVQPAMDAIKQWKYKPYLLEGRPVEVETDIQVMFLYPVK
jgi:TonB family protein